MIIIAHLYLFCSAFAEQWDSAMLEIMPRPIKRGSWGSYIAQVLPDIPSYVPYVPAAGLLYGNLQNCAMWSQGKDAACCCPFGAAWHLLQLPHRCHRELQGADIRTGGHCLCLLTCSNHLDSQARTSTTAVSTSDDVNDVHWGISISSGNLMRFIVFTVQVINIMT